MKSSFGSLELVQLPASTSFEPELDSIYATFPDLRQGAARRAHPAAPAGSSGWAQSRPRPAAPGRVCAGPCPSACLKYWAVRRAKNAEDRASSSPFANRSHRRPMRAGVSEVTDWLHRAALFLPKLSPHAKFFAPCPVDRPCSVRFWRRCRRRYRAIAPSDASCGLEHQLDFVAVIAGDRREHWPEMRRRRRRPEIMGKRASQGSGIRVLPPASTRGVR